MRWLRTISTHPARNQHIGLVSTDGQISRRQRGGPFSARARHRRAALRGRLGLPYAGIWPSVRGGGNGCQEGCGHDQGFLGFAGLKFAPEVPITPDSDWISNGR